MTVTSTSNPIDIPTFEQIATIVSDLVVDYGNMAQTYYDMFYNTTPMDINLTLFDGAGTLKEYVVPNRAKDFRYCRNGKGSPEGVLASDVGTIYQDTENGSLYIKKLGDGTTGWLELNTTDFVEKGYGTPEGRLSRSKGTLFVDASSGNLYIKTTSTGVNGWSLISANTTILADTSLSNLTSDGLNKFSNPDLSNLSVMGESHFADPNLSNLTSTGEQHFLNKMQISNCLLSIPDKDNWVTYDTSVTPNTITFKQGCKFLIPSGRNLDGTLNNIEYTLPNDVSGSIPVWNGSTTRYCLFLTASTNTPVITELGMGSYYEGSSQPVLASIQTSCYWYDTWNNELKYYNTTSGEWLGLAATFMGFYEVENKASIQPQGYDPTDPTQAIPNTLIPSSIKIFSPIRVLTDKDILSLTDYPMPSDVIIPFATPAMGVWESYWANRSGWFSFVISTGNESYYLSSLGWSFYTRDASQSVGKLMLSSHSTDVSGTSGYCPVKKGDWFGIKYYASTEYPVSVYLNFIPAEGEV